MNYDNMLLSELEREAYNTQNKLALAIFKRLEAEAEQVVFAETIKTKYVGEPVCK